MVPLAPKELTRPYATGLWGDFYWIKIMSWSGIKKVDIFNNETRCGLRMRSWQLGAIFVNSSEVENTERTPPPDAADSKCPMFAFSDELHIAHEF